MRDALFISIGAIFGALTRAGLQTLFLAVSPCFPWGTFVANSLGAFLAGLIWGILPASMFAFKSLLMVGFLGSLTTLSGLALEMNLMIVERRYLAAFGHWFSGCVLAFCVCGAGMWLSQRLS